MRILQKYLLVFLVILSIVTRPKNIGICIVATNKYIKFVKPLIVSCQKYFLPAHRKCFFVFTDQTHLKLGDDVMTIFWDHRPWPLGSMQRFEAYWRHRKCFRHMDYLFSCDADMLFVNTVDDDILKSTIAVQHPYYPPGTDPAKFPYERNKMSCAYIDGGRAYYAGGIYGGAREKFVRLVKFCMDGVNTDLSQNFIARWHDESHLNKFFLRYRPHVVLSRIYCVPEEAHSSFPEAKLLALKKEHKEIRKDNWE